MSKKKKEKWFLELDGNIYLKIVKGSKVKRELIDGKTVLKVILRALEDGISIMHKKYNFKDKNND